MYIQSRINSIINIPLGKSIVGETHIPTNSCYYCMLLLCIYIMKVVYFNVCTMHSTKYNEYNKLLSFNDDNLETIFMYLF